MRGAGLAHGRGADARLYERRGRWRAHGRAGELHLYSRSRRQAWHKGETSGNVQAVRALRIDCDGDTLLALVEPAGPACHTGERTCFHRGELDPAAPHEVLPTLERTLRARASERPEGSYTVTLLDDPALAGAKVREEAEEVARAVREESDERVDEEAADLLYHLLVLVHGRERGSPTPSGCSMAAVAESTAYNLIPVCETFIADCETPVSAFLKLRALAPSEPAFLLESADQGQRVGRWSFIGVRPRSVLRWSLADGGDPYAIAAEHVARHRQAPLPDDAPPFAGGAVGFFGYDLVRTVEPLGEPNPDPLGLPDMALMLSDALVAFDHLKHTITILANADLEAEPDPERARASAQRTIGEIRCALAGPVRWARRAVDRRPPMHPWLTGRPPGPVRVDPPSRRRVRCRGFSRTCPAPSSNRWSSGSSSTSTPAMRSRSCPPSAGPHRRPCRRSRSTGACAR